MPVLIFSEAFKVFLIKELTNDARAEIKLALIMRCKEEEDNVSLIK